MITGYKTKDGADTVFPFKRNDTILIKGILYLSVTNSYNFGDTQSTNFTVTIKNGTVISQTGMSYSRSDICSHRSSSDKTISSSVSIAITEIIVL